jgi:hypothetical protein
MPLDQYIGLPSHLDGPNQAEASHARLRCRSATPGRCQEAAWVDAGVSGLRELSFIGMILLERCLHILLLKDPQFA